MRTIPLIARGAVTYQGLNRSYAVAAGERFDADPVDAAVLRYRNQVDFAPRERASTDPPAIPAPPAAETPEVMGDSPLVDPTMDPADEDKIPPRRRRSYRRRDLTAEDSED